MCGEVYDDLCDLSNLFNGNKCKCGIIINNSIIFDIDDFTDKLEINHVFSIKKNNSEYSILLTYACDMYCDFNLELYDENNIFVKNVKNLQLYNENTNKILCKKAENIKINNMFHMYPLQYTRDNYIKFKIDIDNIKCIKFSCKMCFVSRYVRQNYVNYEIHDELYDYSVEKGWQLLPNLILNATQPLA